MKNEQRAMGDGQYRIPFLLVGDRGKKKATQLGSHFLREFYFLEINCPYIVYLKTIHWKK